MYLVIFRMIAIERLDVKARRRNSDSSPLESDCVCVCVCACAKSRFIYVCSSETAAILKVFIEQQDMLLLKEIETSASVSWSVFL